MPVALPLLILLAAPLAAAFTVLPVTTLAFPEIPLDLGIRHIHTPEHFAVAHGMALPHFKLTETSPPQRVGEYALIAFRFRTIFGERSARMFTDDRCVSHLLFQDADDRAYLLTTLAVTQNGIFGHNIRVHGTVFNERPLLERLATAATVTREGVHDAILRGYSVRNEDENLLAYRRMVLFGE